MFVCGWGVSPYLGRVARRQWQGNGSSGKRIANAAAPTRKPARAFASFTTLIKHLRATEPDAPEASSGARQPECCHQTLQTILWEIPNRFPICWRIRSIAYAAVSLIHVWPMRMGYLSSVLLRALEQGPMEERLAYIEAILGKSGAGSELFEIRSTKDAVPEQASTPKEGE